MENRDAERNHTNRHKSDGDYGKSSEFAFQGFALILLVCEESFLLSVKSAYTVGIARLKHNDDDKENRAKRRYNETRNTNYAY